MKPKSCDKPCGPGDFYEGGYCDLHGCFKSRSDQFRERLEKMQFEDYCHIDSAYEKRLKKHIMDAYNEVHQ